MDPPTTPPPPPVRRLLTRDERLRIQLLKELNWKQAAIAEHENVSIRQVSWAINHRATPQKQRCGTKSKLNSIQIQILIQFISASRINRRMPYFQVAAVLDWPDVGEYAIQHALEKEGYHRRVGRVKPPISEKNRVLRLAWAEEHLMWTWKQWCIILWTDETWVTGGRHTKTYVTRKAGEEFEPTCIVDKIQRKSGWMFWGCFSGLTDKRPGLFWEKAWKSINKDSYIEHTIPVIDTFIRQYPELFLMQDHAPGHAPKLTLAEFEKRRIQLIFWPPFSPDLNPIETVWNLMKDWIQNHYPDDKLSYKVLRQAVMEAWEAVGWQQLEDLLVSMPRRCEAVIAANGMYTKF